MKGLRPETWFATQLRLLALEDSTDDCLVRFTFGEWPVLCTVLFTAVLRERRRIEIPRSPEECQRWFDFWSEKIGDVAKSVPGLRFSLKSDLVFRLTEAAGMGAKLIAEVKRSRLTMAADILGSPAS